MNTCTDWCFDVIYFMSKVLTKSKTKSGKECTANTRNILIILWSSFHFDRGASFTMAADFQGCKGCIGSFSIEYAVML